ncbi:AMP-binding protein [Blastomonas sp.]|uniref:AMP-binding protein n=1 Tax=Blastomonas sp. TaxID=1909299 RepID=UPI00262C159C|nr:AMP-binding protein [Blastomonas sp.]MDM7957641.1 AMP-binding protein [Blastomonas sp.]
MTDATSDTLIEAFIAAAQIKPDARFVAVSDVRASSDALADIVLAGRQMGTRLIAMGIAPGDVIGIMLPNWREWLVACVAAQQAGAVMLPIVTIYGAAELGFILRQSRAKLLFTPDHWRGIDYARVVRDCGTLPDLAHHIITGSTFAALEDAGPVDEPEKRSADDLAMLVYTSGTTADPKGVMHSSRTLLAELAAQKESRTVIADEVVLTPWPPGHVAGALSLLRFLAQGVPVVAMDQWNAQAAAELISNYDITSSSGTPFHLNGLLEAADVGEHDLSSLRNYIVGAAPVPTSLVERCVAKGLAVYHCYGSSEHPTVTTGTADDPLDKRLNTEGRAMAGAEMRFVDDDGNDVPPHCEGEIVTRGADLFIGYLDQRLNDAAFLPGGWYRTGDIGRLDEDGYLLITDRKKDIIIRGGENISSKEVENILLTHPAIADVAVVAAPDARMGEIVCACVVLAPDTVLTLEDIKGHFVAAAIARQKTPERLSVMDALPRNASGKVLKHLLRTTI